MPQKPKKIIVFDTETTGLPAPARVPLSEQPYIVELGVVIIIGGEIVDKVDQLLLPPIPIPPESTKTHHIVDSMVVNAPKFSDYYIKLNELFKDAHALVAHNASFDVAMLGNELNRIGKNKVFNWPPRIICTIQEYYPLFGFRPSLQKLYEYVFDEPLGQTHRALDDAMALAKILIETKFCDAI